MNQLIVGDARMESGARRWSNGPPWLVCVSAGSGRAKHVTGPGFFCRSLDKIHELPLTHAHNRQSEDFLALRKGLGVLLGERVRGRRPAQGRNGISMEKLAGHGKQRYPMGHAGRT